MRPVVANVLGPRVLIPLWVTLTVAVIVVRCAGTQCELNSDCGPQARCVDNRCVTECLADRDCPASRPYCNINGMCVRTMPAPDGGDSGRDVSVPPDANPPPPDVPFPPPDVPSPPPDAVPSPDAPPPPPPDGPTTGTRGYLDPCTSDGECASGICTSTLPRFCTRACRSHSDCAEGQICSAGRCQLDDTGRTGCDLTSGSPCLEYCYGTPSASHCTHSCNTASDCPAGYACASVGGGRKVCVDIERPCTRAEQCPSGMGFCGPGGVGCTVQCSSASDCPNRLVGLPPYRCQSVSGVSVCVPPEDVMGSDPLGAVCSSTGTITCRSGACDEGTSPPTCNQRCTSRGGCPLGWGCFPLVDGTDVLLVCTQAGSGWIGDPCTRARDCVTGLCTADRYCTRLCTDGICPTGMTCRDTGVRATDGTPIRLCTR